MKHTFVHLFVRWFPQTQIFQENCSVLMPFDSHGQVSLLPVISLRFLLKAWCRNHCVFHGLLQALWQLYVALGLPCLEAPKAWLEAMFALGELQRSPVLLLRASTTKLLLILISFHPGKYFIGQFVFEHFHRFCLSACTSHRLKIQQFSQVRQWTDTFSDPHTNTSNRSPPIYTDYHRIIES